MEKNELKKFTIQKETISNLSKNAQGLIWGGYYLPGSIAPIICYLSVDNWTKCPDAPDICSGTCDLIDCDSHTYDFMTCPSENNKSCYNCKD